MGSLMSPCFCSASAPAQNARSTCLAEEPAERAAVRLDARVLRVLTRHRAEIRAVGEDARASLLRELERLVLAVLVGPDEDVRDADLLGRRVLRLVHQIDLPRAAHEIVAAAIEGRLRFALDLLAARHRQDAIDLSGDSRLDFGILVEALRARFDGERLGLEQRIHQLANALAARGELGAQRRRNVRELRVEIGARYLHAARLNEDIGRQVGRGRARDVHGGDAEYGNGDEA